MIDLAEPGEPRTRPTYTGTTDQAVWSATAAPPNGSRWPPDGRPTRRTGRSGRAGGRAGGWAGGRADRRFGQRAS